MIRIVTLITCHNRREKTLECLDALFACDIPRGFSLKVILVNDGSSDGTETAVRAKFPVVEILTGGGSLFWNRGMHKAFSHAMAVGFDAYLWLNDDTLLYPKALSDLLNAWQVHKEQTGEDVILVGSTCDSQRNMLTYGGIVNSHFLKPFSYSPVIPKEKMTNCHTMNGNCVLIPYFVAVQTGNLDPNFAHAMGDIDYGLRAVKAGFKLYVAPGFVGVCDKNTVIGTFNDRTLSRKERWKKIMQPKGLPLSSWLILTRRHGGLLWPIYFLWPYLKIWVGR